MNRRPSNVLFLQTVLLLLVATIRSCGGFVPPPTRHKAQSTPFSRLTASQYDETCDVVVLGSGPAGRAVASLLGASSSLNVVLCDQNHQREFPPNYGVWHDEWAAIVDKYKQMGVSIQGGDAGDAIDHKWSTTDCFFGGSFDIPTEKRMHLERPYYRVDKNALKESFSSGNNNYKVVAANHMVTNALSPNVYAPVNALVHDQTGSTLTLQRPDASTLSLRTKLVVDCTGHETKLVLRDSREITNGPGFQIAYGCMVEVQGDGVTDTHMGPYSKNSMTLFDYRTDHYDNDTDDTIRAKVQQAPTFMYAMPLTDNRIFFEETSLVARPALSFVDCKERCMKRLQYHNIKVTKLLEEEYCYIPMGGALPAKDQRVIGLGGASVLVHPSTGYHLCRCLTGAVDVAQVIVQELSNQQDINLDRAAARSYHALWSPDNVRQRNFAVFGGEFLMKQNVVGLRGFFDGFFRLPLPLWAGFLAGWPGLPNNDRHETWFARMWFGINFIARLPLPVALDMAARYDG